MTRTTLTAARYGLIFGGGGIEVVYAVALIQALGYSNVKPSRVCCFEGDRAVVIDDGTLEKCWQKRLAISN